MLRLLSRPTAFVGLLPATSSRPPFAPAPLPASQHPGSGDGGGGAAAVPQALQPAVHRTGTSHTHPDWRYRLLHSGGRAHPADGLPAVRRHPAVPRHAGQDRRGGGRPRHHVRKGEFCQQLRVCGAGRCRSRCAGGAAGGVESALPGGRNPRPQPGSHTAARREVAAGTPSPPLPLPSAARARSRGSFQHLPPCCRCLLPTLAGSTRRARCCPSPSPPPAWPRCSSCAGWGRCWASWSA